MPPLNDRQIRELALNGMIDPFSDSAPGQSRKGVVSYGLSSFGYDMRAADDFKLCVDLGHASRTLDVKSVEPVLFASMVSQSDSYGTFVVIPPHGFALTSSVERFKIPRDVVVVTYGKSTYARVGLIVNVTPMEPEWEGRLTIEMSNTTDMPVKVYVGEGIAQAVFHRGEPCEWSYADKKGKYQGQKGTTLAR